MDNKEIYKKTLGFSLRRFLWDFLAVIAFCAITVGAFFIAESTANNGLIGLVIGLVLGGIAAYLILHYIAFTYKAGQIAMMTKGVTEDKLPDDVIGAGKKIVKERFTTVAAYYVVTGAIKGVFNQIGQGISAVGNAVGGDTGGAIGSSISAVINTVIAYLCDCCLGWVFYRKDEKATKATCEGAVIFFKHGKTLLKNLGRVFGIGIISLLVIGGIFFGISYVIMINFPDFFNSLSQAIIEAGAETSTTLPDFIYNVNTLTLISALVIGIAFWAILHSVFVRPFVLVGVLRNFMKSGIDDIPTEESFKELDSKSKKFAKLHSEL